MATEQSIHSNSVLSKEIQKVWSILDKICASKRLKLECPLERIGMVISYESALNLTTIYCLGITWA